MSLTIGSGPFSTDSRGVLSTGEVPRGATYAEPYPRRVRALLGGQALLDTDKAWMSTDPDSGQNSGSRGTRSTHPAWRAPP